MCNLVLRSSMRPLILLKESFDCHVQLEHSSLVVLEEITGDLISIHACIFRAALHIK